MNKEQNLIFQQLKKDKTVVGRLVLLDWLSDQGFTAKKGTTWWAFIEQTKLELLLLRIVEQALTSPIGKDSFFQISKRSRVRIRACVTFVDLFYEFHGINQTVRGTRIIPGWRLLRTSKKRQVSYELTKIQRKVDLRFWDDFKKMALLGQVQK